MARIKLLNDDGKPQLTKDGRFVTLFSVDGRKRVIAGELVEVWEKQQIGDKKKNVLVAYRPKTKKDKDEDLKARKAKMKKLAAEIAAEEAAELATDKLADTAPSSKNEEAAEDAFEVDLEDVEENDTPAKPAGRTRPARAVK